MSDHYFTLSTDPRRENACLKCGRTPETHTPNPDIERNITDERAIKEYAASLSPQLLGLNYQGLFSLSEERALEGPVRDADRRDNWREIAEEVSDACNYAVWQIQKLNRAGEDGSLMEWYAVIIKACELWATLQEARD